MPYKRTGRPPGRPKTKAYVTLMARVDVVLADRVKHYAALHRQPLSVVIRDALTLLMDEYPSSADLTGPHQLAEHEFLSDRYESPLDTLVGETDSAELEALLYDTKIDAIESILSYTNGDTAYLSDTNGDETMVSDTKKVPANILSDTNIPPFNESRYVLGEKLCRGKHAYGSTGKTLLTINGRKCPQCQTEGQRQRREAKRQAMQA